MATKKLNISDFQTEKLSKKQQQTVSGGDVDPSKGEGKGATIAEASTSVNPVP